MEQGMWDQRYGADEYAYGNEPNVFIKEAANKYLKTSCICVEMASGEGRNAVYLAKLGHTVHAVDFSSAGVDKTKQLAQQQGVSDRVIAVVADIFEWDPPHGPGTVDCVLFSFCHVLGDRRKEFYERVIGMLKAGGLIILEVFNPDQIAKGYQQQSGGPKDPGMMVTLQQLRDIVSHHAGTELEAAELEYVLHEGKYHEGLGAVTRYVWQKA